MLPPKTEPQMAADWFRAWFGEEADQYCVVSQMVPGKGRTITRHRSATPAELVEIIETYGIDDLVYDGERQWNLYMGVGLMAEPPAAGKKGGKADIVGVPGVWVDLDADKHGFFDDEEHCLRFLRELPEDVWPTIVVATGTGGVHAYWKTERILGADEAERLCTMWWTWLSSRTDAKIDKLINADRVMKLPGSIRWPKTTGDPASLVRLLYADTERVVHTDTLVHFAGETYEAHLADIIARRQKIQRSKLEAAQVASELSGWNMLIALSTVEDDFNQRYSWDDILIPQGWTKIDQDSEGRDIWARPGLAMWELHKSASTDYQGSHVMTLFSDSEETGLSHLLDTGVVLTKYRVYVETVWKGDEAGFVRAYLSGEQ